MNDGMLSVIENLTEEKVSGRPSYLRTPRILVIEDHEEVSRALSFRLANEGFEVVSASDGLDGLEEIAREEPDLVVLDLGLPRMHGFKLLHRLRMGSTVADLPIVVVTGNPDPRIEERCRRWGVARVFRKPTRQTKIIRAIREVLEGIAEE